jgi:hypothetical protein
MVYYGEIIVDGHATRSGEPKSKKKFTWARKDWSSNARVERYSYLLIDIYLQGFPEGNEGSVVALLGRNGMGKRYHSLDNRPRAAAPWRNNFQEMSPGCRLTPSRGGVSAWCRKAVKSSRP